MKASELIAKLQDLLTEYDDLDMVDDNGERLYDVEWGQGVDDDTPDAFVLQF
jgi:hypothetical protein